MLQLKIYSIIIIWKNSRLSRRSFFHAQSRAPLQTRFKTHQKHRPRGRCTFALCFQGGTRQNYSRPNPP